MTTTAYYTAQTPLVPADAPALESWQFQFYITHDNIRWRIHPDQWRFRSPARRHRGGSDTQTLVLVDPTAASGAVAMTVPVDHWRSKYPAMYQS